MKQQHFPYLKPKDQVRILCTARSAQKADLLPAQQLLESWGLIVSYGTTIDAVDHQMGGNAALRASDFQEALDDDEVQAIWIARGGYGTVQIIDAVDYSAFAKANSKKLIMGYSDVTVLHSHLQTLGIPSLHCFMPLELKTKPSSSIESFKSALLGEPQSVVIENNNALKPIEISAAITGGNLSILYSLLGSHSFPKTDGCILFIEDIDEYVYHIERMMYGLKRARHLENIKALIVGGMSDMRDHEIPHGKNAQEIITDLTAGYDYPVIFNFPGGHISDNRSLKLGVNLQLTIQKEQIIFTY